MERDLSACYRPCLTCHAPAMDPFPAAWTLELVKEGRADGPVRAHVTPHRDTCTAPPADPQPGIAMRIPGEHIAAMRIMPPPVPADALGRVAAANVFTTDTPGSPGWDTGVDWQALGRTDGDGVAWHG